MERHGHLQLGPEIRASLPAMSAATINRSLRGPRDRAGGRKHVGELGATLGPIRLLRQMRGHQQRVANQPKADPQGPTAAPPEQFRAGLRTAWADGEARPTAPPQKKPKRSRRRPDPLVKVTEQLRARLEAEPWSTSRQLLEKLQAAHTLASGGEHNRRFSSLKAQHGCVH